MLVASYHHDFDRTRPPAITVEDGAQVTFRSWDVAWGMENHHAGGGPRQKAARTGDGPCLCGPVAIREARPGRVLKIFLESVRPGTWGWTLAGGDAGRLA